jgi:hypothetical protein
VGRPLWREDGSVFCMCRWPLPAQSFSVLVSLDWRPYFIVSDLRLPFSSAPTTCRVTVEVFDPASTRVLTVLNWALVYNHFERTTQKTQPLYCWEFSFTAPLYSNGSYSIVTAGMCLPRRCLSMNVYSDFAIPAFGCHVTLCFQCKTFSHFQWHHQYAHGKIKNRAQRCREECFQEILQLHL